MALVPLRMVEITQEVGSNQGAVVLGEQIIVEPEPETADNQVYVDTVLPEIESPYVEMETAGCLDAYDVEMRSIVLMEEIDSGKISQSQINDNIKLIEQLQGLVCR